MVRIKQRYILFDILYPPTQDKSKTSHDEFTRFSNSPKNALLSLHQSSPSNVNPKTLTNTLRKSISDVYGEFGAGSAGMQLSVKYFSNKTSTGIIRCGRESYKIVVAALTMIDELEGNSVILRCTRVSGTIKKCEQYSIARTRELMTLVGKNDGQKDLDSLMNTFKSSGSKSDSEGES